MSYTVGHLQNILKSLHADVLNQKEWLACVQSGKMLHHCRQAFMQKLWESMESAAKSVLFIIGPNGVIFSALSGGKMMYLLA